MEYFQLEDKRIFAFLFVSKLKVNCPKSESN